MLSFEEAERTFSLDKNCSLQELGGSSEESEASDSENETPAISLKIPLITFLPSPISANVRLAKMTLPAHRPFPQGLLLSTEIIVVNYLRMSLTWLFWAS